MSHKSSLMHTKQIELGIGVRLMKLLRRKNETLSATMSRYLVLWYILCHTMTACYILYLIFNLFRLSEYMKKYYNIQ